MGRPHALDLRGVLHRLGETQGGVGEGVPLGLQQQLSAVSIQTTFSLSHSFIHSLIHQFIHSLTHQFIHSLTHSLIQTQTNSPIHLFTNSPIHSFTRLLTHLFIHSLVVSAGGLVIAANCTVLVLTLGMAWVRAQLALSLIQTRSRELREALRACSSGSTDS